ncbi:MAG: hypothetical protein ACO3JL_17640 [Myxococcota bacterium]
MMTRTRLLVQIWFGALLLSPAISVAPAHATVVLRASLEEMSARSDVIVHGRVAEQTVVREPEVGLVTLTEVEVLDGLKGAKTGDVLTIYQVGGSLNGEHSWISGAHRHRLGDEMVFFAMRHKERVVGYGIGLGKYVVDREGRVPGVREDLSDVLRLTKGENGELRADIAEPDQHPSLDAFKEYVRRAAQATLSSVEGGMRPAALPRLISPAPLRLKEER